MSIRRMSLGAGYRYLMASVARADLDRGTSGLTKYYAVSGTPPGRFLGAGLAGLNGGKGVAAGAVVSEEALFRMLGMLQDPVIGQPLGRAPSASAVAGFDLTFSAPKSVSVLWGLADDETRMRISEAHQAALQQVITHAELHVFASRTGAGGPLTVPVRGVVAAGFDHWDSRAGDPQLHTHVVILNRVQGLNGVWRTLDSKALFAQAVELSELYNGLLADHLTATLGVAWTPGKRLHSDVPRWEINGIPAALRDEFSQRSHDINAEKDTLISRFRAAHGRPPTSDEVLRLRQQATLATRPDKQAHSLGELLDDWRDRAERLGVDPNVIAASALGRKTLPLLARTGFDSEMLATLGRNALAAVADKRATFTRSNLAAQVLRQLHGVRLADPTDRARLTHDITDRALKEALLLQPAGPEPTPWTRGRDRFTTPAILEAETRVIDLAHDLTAPTAPTAELTDAPVGLSADQAAAIDQIAMSGRTVDLLIGPAGAGKTTTLATLRARWEATQGPGSVLGLAPSATAAHVLADELGISADNTAKWLTETTNNHGRRAQIERYQALLREPRNSVAHRRIRDRIDQVQAELNRWSIQPGQLVILDEGSLAGTLILDEIACQTRTAGAKLLLVGDPAQLGSVQAGGIFAHLATLRTDVPALTEVHRFTHDWEKNATQRLRAGDPTVIADYTEHNRVHPGSRNELLRQMLTAWDHDSHAGLSSLMIAADHATATDLNRLARQHRIDRGDISADGVPLRDGTSAGVGDLIVTRRNDRTLRTSTGWVRNGDLWTITDRHPDGSLRLRSTRAKDEVTLPPGYVEQHIDLGYATTLHQVQGRTSDTAHAYLTPATQQNQLYVAATRGRHANHLYLDTSWDPDPDTRHDPACRTAAATATLAGIITAPTLDQRPASSWPQLTPRSSLPWRPEAAPGVHQHRSIGI
ncbi:MAG TPA: MobF family relaxase [Jatrophihabitans sp.]|nr:MobF family relaxase [Jatrophihabitans sp.]